MATEKLESSLLGKYYCRLSIGEYSRPSPFSTSNFAVTKIINLPLPTELSDATPVGYSSAEFESVGDAFNGDEFGAFETASQRNAIKATADAAGKFVEGIFGKKSFTAKAVAGVTEGVGSNARIISSAIQQSAGIAPNPNPTVVFTGSSLRDFALTWMFSPKNPDESKRIKKVIQILKSAALPENSSFNSGAILRYPNIVQLNFFPWDTNINSNTAFTDTVNSQWGWSDNSIIKVKKCMMGSVNVNYTPSNVPAFFNDGGEYHPVAISLSINFKEIEYMLSGDWGGNYGQVAIPPANGETPRREETLTEKFDRIISDPNAPWDSKVGAAIGNSNF